MANNSRTTEPPFENALVDLKSGRVKDFRWKSWLRLKEQQTLSASTIFLTGTHAVRLTTLPSGYQAGTVFLESDRGWFYEDTGAAWRWESGFFFTTTALLPVDLGGQDAGALVFATDSGFLYTWNGAAWKVITGSLPAIVDALTFTLEIRRGLKAALPAAMAVGEPYYATDTNELYFGTGAGTHKAETDANSIQGIPVSATPPTAGQILIADPSGSYIPGDPIVSGTAADNASPVGSPVRVAGAGTDGKVHTLLTDERGRLQPELQLLRELQKTNALLADLCYLITWLKEPMGVNLNIWQLRHYGKNSLENQD